MTSYPVWVVVWTGPLLLLTLVEATVAQSCTYARKEYLPGSPVKMDEPCLSCSCVRGQLVCHLRMCPTLPEVKRKGCKIEKVPEKCCPQIICDSTNTTSSGFGKYLHGNQVGRKDDDGFYYQSPVQSRANKNGAGCKVDESYFADGSALPSSTPCTNCYCLKGSVKCINPKCHLNITGCSPQYNHQHACCPTHYDCSSLNGVSVDDGKVRPTKPTIIRKVCFWKSRRYPEGTRIPSDDVCKSCFCVHGTVKCTTQECAPPVPGCTPIRQKGYCCPLEYECDTDYNSTTTEPSLPEDTTTILNNKIRGNDRVIDFPYDQLGNDYQLVKKTSSSASGRASTIHRSQDKIKNNKGLRRPTAKFPAEFKEEEIDEEESPQDTRKPVRSATSMLYFPPRGNTNRKNLFSKRQRTTTIADNLITETATHESSEVSTDENLTTVSDTVKSTLKSRRKTTTENSAVTRQRPRKRTTTQRNKDITRSTTTLPPSTITSTTTTTELPVTTKIEKNVYLHKVPLITVDTKLMSEATTESHQAGYHVLDAGESYSGEFDGFHEESAFGIEWPGLAANVYDYFKEVSHGNNENDDNEENVLEVTEETSEESTTTTKPHPSTTMYKTTSKTTEETPVTTTTTVPTTISTEATTKKLTTTTTTAKTNPTTLFEEVAREKLDSTSRVPETTITELNTTTETTTKETETTVTTTTPTSTTAASTTTRNNDLLLPTSESSESRLVFLRKVGLNFQVGNQKSQPSSGINWTSRLAPDGHPAIDATRLTKTGTATIHKISPHEGRGSTRLLIEDDKTLATSRVGEGTLLEDPSALDEVEFPLSEDSPAFQVIPFLPEDAVVKEEQNNFMAANNSNWQSITKAAEKQSKYATTTTAKSNAHNMLLNITQERPLANVALQSPRSDSKTTQTFLTRWIPIRREDSLPTANKIQSTDEDNLTSSASGLSVEKSSAESQENEESSPLLGFLSLFGFSGLGGAKKANITQNIVTTTTTHLPLLVTKESNGWLPLRPEGHEVKPGVNIPTFTVDGQDQLLLQPISTAALGMRIPNATGNMFLIGQPKEDHAILDHGILDHGDGHWSGIDGTSNKPSSATTEPLLEMILSHIHNSSEREMPVTVVNSKQKASTIGSIPLRHSTTTVTTTTEYIETTTTEKPSSVNHEDKTFSNNISMETVTSTSVHEETTPVSLWDLLNLFGSNDATEQESVTTTKSNEDKDYYSLSSTFNNFEDPVSSIGGEANLFGGLTEKESSNVDEAKEEGNSDDPINIPENEAVGNYNPFILQVKGCDVYGKYYNMGEIIKELSSMCKECVCSGFGVDCNTTC